jgi:hypothetical protein
MMTRTFRELAIVSTPAEGGGRVSQNRPVSRIRITVAIIVIVCGLTILGGAHSFAQTSAPSGGLTADEAAQIATDAYIYGYPLVTMEYTRRVMTNVAEPEGTRAPMGHLVRLRTYPTAAFKDVTAPNADTLYTTAWINVSKEPWVISIPDAHGRYYLFPMLDAWTDVFQVPGKRTTGTGAQTYAITGPNWTGTLPPGVTEYKSPTDMVWILGRIYCSGTPADYKAVHEMQDKITLVPLSSIRQALHASWGHGRSEHRHENRSARAGERS